MAKLGDDSVHQERFLRQYYNAFRKKLNAPKATTNKLYPLGRVAAKSNLIGIYENLIKYDLTKLVGNLNDMATIYANCFDDRAKTANDCLNNSLLDLMHVESASAYILLLNLFANKVAYKITEEKEIKEIVDFLVKFFVRRNLTDKPNTKNLISLFMEVTEEITEKKLTGRQIVERVYSKLRPMAATMQEFKERLSSLPVYKLHTDMTRFLLCYHAERCDLTKEKFAAGFWARTEKQQYVWTIEHIMPEGNLSADWTKMIAGGDQELADGLQEEYGHSLGNLTLTGYNSKLSSSSFIIKRDKVDAEGKRVGYKNGLSMNSDIIEKDAWTISDIKIRTEKLAETILGYFSFQNEKPI